MEPRNRTWQLISAALAVIVVALAVVLVVTRDDSDSDEQTSPVPAATTKANGVVRMPLGQADPTNAPGQSLYLQQVVIAPHAQLPEHYHQGTQVAHVISGVLTYNIVSGSAAVTRAGGKTEGLSAPNKVLLYPGDSLVETRTLTHFGANDTDKPVVIELAALLEQGAPLATPVTTSVPSS